MIKSAKAREQRNAFPGAFKKELERLAHLLLGPNQNAKKKKKKKLFQERTNRSYMVRGEKKCVSTRPLLVRFRWKSSSPSEKREFQKVSPEETK